VSGGWCLVAGVWWLMAGNWMCKCVCVGGGVQRG
jgi:hypothetical protein